MGCGTGLFVRRSSKIQVFRGRADGLRSTASRVRGAGSASDQNQKQKTEEHGAVHARFMRGLPKPLVEKHRDLRRSDGHADVDKKRNRGQSREEPNKQKRSARDFDHADKRRHDRGGGNSNFQEPAHAKSVGEKKFLDSLGQEDGSHGKPDKNDRFGLSQRVSD